MRSCNGWDVRYTGVTPLVRLEAGAARRFKVGAAKLVLANVG